MSFVVFDTETTGLTAWALPADHPNQPRLASWCLLFVDNDLKITEGHHGLVKPDRWLMPQEASRVNGLTNERLHAEGKDIRLPLSLMAEAIDQGRTLVAHNLLFDTKIMRGEFRRLDWGRDDKNVAYKYADRCRSGICTMLRFTSECQLPRSDGKRGYKWPRLEEACRIVLGREPSGAHSAVGDAMDCLSLLRVMRERGMLREFGKAA